MAKTANLYIRIEPDVKEDSEKLFSQFGITISDAVNLFLHQSLLVGGLPFEVKQPRYNRQTEKAMQEAQAIVSGTKQAKRYKNAAEMMADFERDA